jgi:hypothetical protein
LASKDINKKTNNCLFLNNFSKKIKIFENIIDIIPIVMAYYLQPSCGGNKKARFPP